VTSSEPGHEPDQDPQRDENLPPTHQPYGTPAAPQSPYGQNPYGQHPYDQNPYGQNAHGQEPGYGQPGQPYGQGGYAPSGYGAPYGYGAAPANHPSATTALVLSLIGLAGIAFCGGLTLVLSPFAWRIGARAVREIDASQGRLGGREQANAGRIMGIIGTVLLALGILLALALVALLVASGTSEISYGTRAG
jgi:hypothetical protein